MGQAPLLSSSSLINIDVYQAPIPHSSTPLVPHTPIAGQTRQTTEGE